MNNLRLHSVLLLFALGCGDLARGGDCNQGDSTVTCCLKKNPGQYEKCGASESQRHMLGARGPQFPSKTVWREPRTHGARLDVENPAPGQRPGQIHYQEGGTKYLYDREKNTFIGAPRRVQDLLQNRDFKLAVEKALKYLGEQ